MEDENNSKSKEVLLKQKLVDQDSSTTPNTFMPQYLSLTSVISTENSITDSKLASSTRDSLKNSNPSKCFVDVAFISNDGDAILCNKLYLIR